MIRTYDYPLRVPETIVFPEVLVMRLIKGSLAGPVLAGILAVMPAAAFAHGGGGGGHGDSDYHQVTYKNRVVSRPTPNVADVRTR